MAHLWSKFTKCLRPSEGAFDPGLRHPPSVALRAHNAASFAIITSSLSPPRGSNEVSSSSFIVRSSPRTPSLRSSHSISLTQSLSLSLSLFSSPRSLKFAFHFSRDLPSRPELPIIENTTLITKYRPSRLSIFPRRDAPVPLFTTEAVVEARTGERRRAN